jgi:prepilin-type N-terminal cleavage/methylation domain-containing protein
MKKLTIKNKNGFTIIEVVLVLAIAGLIFLMVFIALPALQRNQRDAQRKNDLGRLLTALQNYRANNKGKAPPHSDFRGKLVPNYLEVGGDDFRDPSGLPYRISSGTIGTAPIRATNLAEDSAEDYYYIIRVYRGARCVGENTEAFGSDNNIAFSIKLEGGGVYCVNN